ncbi:MAG: endonuclease III, partial [Ruminococcaceae bacterium]|nr:endonuclease III [Oscillospiraceae bacterium]
MERAALIVERLKTVYPSPECALEYGGEPWKLLVMGRLSAQCTDARVNIVCRELFSKYPTARALADGELSEIEEIVRPCGLFRTKAESIKAACR